MPQTYTTSKPQLGQILLLCGPRVCVCVCVCVWRLASTGARPRVYVRVHVWLPVSVSEARSFSLCPCVFSEAHKDVQPRLRGHGGRDDQLQPAPLPLPRGRPPHHDHQSLRAQDPPAHGQSPDYQRGAALLRLGQEGQEG